jgi:hypothetical protein
VEVLLCINQYTIQLKQISKLTYFTVCFRRVPTQAQTKTEHRVRLVTKPTRAKTPGATAKATSSYTGLPQTQKQKSRNKLPTRDLPTKYFGEYLEINDLYKFNT